MNEVNKTLYIPLYGKAYVTNHNCLLKDNKAVSIWNSVQFPLGRKSKSKYLAYYMAMRARVFDDFVKENITGDTIVVHLGCGLDSRVERLGLDNLWIDVDFEEVIQERKLYYTESDTYKMVGCDVCSMKWTEFVDASKPVIVLLEGVSMYLTSVQLQELFRNISSSFGNCLILMDVYSSFAAKMSKYKNPVKDVGVSTVYGLDDPMMVVNEKLEFVSEMEMTPEYLINELSGLEKAIFKKLYAGTFASSLYRLYNYKSK